LDFDPVAICISGANIALHANALEEYRRIILESEFKPSGLVGHE
jgi:hypothetical protein